MLNMRLNSINQGIGVSAQPARVQSFASLTTNFGDVRQSGLAEISMNSKIAALKSEITC